jgi:hypothetical protein
MPQLFVGDLVLVAAVAADSQEVPTLGRATVDAGMARLAALGGDDQTALAFA